MSSVATEQHLEASDAMNVALAQNWWLVALRGVLAIIIGVIAFAAPVATMLSLVLLFSAYMLVDGVFAIVAALRAPRRHGAGPSCFLKGS